MLEPVGEGESHDVKDGDSLLLLWYQVEFTTNASDLVLVNRNASQKVGILIYYLQNLTY